MASSALTAEYWVASVLADKQVKQHSTAAKVRPCSKGFHVDIDEETRALAHRFEAPRP